MQIISVRPGDLIRADDFNDMLRKLQDLDARLSKLESINPAPEAVVIDDISPPTPMEGDEIRIGGRNFGMAVGAARVDFNGVPPGFFKTGSSDTLLICNVPTIPGLPASGAPVTITVHNQASSATKQIIVTPARPSQGGIIDTVLENTDPATITAGQDNFFQFRLRSRARLGATLALTADISQVAWRPSVQILDASKNPMIPPQIHLEPNEEKIFLIKVNIPVGTGGTALSLTVSGSGDGVSTSSGRLDFTVGDEPNVDTSFMLASSGSLPPEALSGTTVTAKAFPRLTQVNVRADFSMQGDYEVRLDPIPPPSGWRVVITDPTAGRDASHIINVPPSDIPAGGAAEKTIQFRVSPERDDTPDGRVQLTVQRQGSDASRTLTFDLVASP